MKRRDFLSGLGAAGVAIAASPVQAYNNCQVMPFGQLCEAGVNLPTMIEAYDPQHMSQWCWAASIEMVFRYYGYQVSQQTIVQQTYGFVGNIPAVTGMAITRNLNRTWTDETGRRFRVSVRGLYDADANILGITDPQIVNALMNEQPLLFGNRSHAMVLVSVAYTPMQIVNVGFADPWPGNGLRGPVNPREGLAMHRGGEMRYLCLPRVEAA